MAENSKKVSELPVTTNVASTDRILVLRDPAGSPSTRTITVNNFISNVSSSIVNTAIAQINTTAAAAYSNAVAYTNTVLQSNLSNYVTNTQFQSNLVSMSITRNVVTVITTPFNANSSHEILNADPALAGANLVVVLPNVGINNGKIYSVKLRDTASGARKITVMTTGDNVLERPSTYAVTNSLDMTTTGEHYTWFYDAGTYRLI